MVIEEAGSPQQAAEKRIFLEHARETRSSDSVPNAEIERLQSYAPWIYRALL